MPLSFLLFSVQRLHLLKAMARRSESGGVNSYHLAAVFWTAFTHHTQTHHIYIYIPPSTVVGCENEACSPAASLNINGFPDRSVKGREKTRQIAGDA